MTASRDPGKAEATAGGIVDFVTKMRDRALLYSPETFGGEPAMLGEEQISRVVFNTTRDAAVELEGGSMAQRYLDALCAGIEAGLTSNADGDLGDGRSHRWRIAEGPLSLDLCVDFRHVPESILLPALAALPDEALAMVLDDLRRRLDAVQQVIPLGSLNYVFAVTTSWATLGLAIVTALGGVHQLAGKPGLPGDPKAPRFRRETVLCVRRLLSA